MVKEVAIESIFSSPFPHDFGFSYRISDSYDLGLLAAEELSLLSNKAVEKRKLHFFLGRISAKEALAQIGIYNFPVLKGTNNEPLWPEGICGAITHTGNIGMACVAPKAIVSGIGIDIERITEKVSWDIVDRVCLPEEKKWVSEVPESKYQRLLMVFSAKESIFKALFPQNPIFFGFHEAELLWDNSLKAFQGRLVFDFSEKFPKGYSFSVGCRVDSEYVFTYIHLQESKSNLFKESELNKFPI